MMWGQEQQQDWLSLVGRLERATALDSLLRGGDTYPHLAIVAGGVQRVDTVAGTATRLRIARHRHAHPSGGVMIVPPTARSVADHFMDLLSPLPEGVTVTGEGDGVGPGTFALVPATIVSDADAAVATAEYALEACKATHGVSLTRARLLAAAIMELADNALRHSEDAVVRPAVAATVSGRERLVEVAVTDLGTEISEAPSPAEALRAIPHARQGQGFLSGLLRRGLNAGVNVSIEVLAGNARLRWTAMRHRTTEHIRVPGTTVVVTLAA